MREVVIDTDYFRFITLDCTDKELFLEIMKELDIMPVMHEFVYRQELHAESFVKSLVENGDIKAICYSDFLKDKGKSEEYDKLAKYAYNVMNGWEFDDEREFKTYHHEKENLGEIHSITMARILKLDIFMSNDGGAKQFVEGRLNSRKHKIQVMNVEDTFKCILENADTNLNWSKIKNVVKQFKKNGTKTDQERYERIQSAWTKF
jgi:hypothetical protein